jgi:hypothetical protein
VHVLADALTSVLAIAGLSAAWAFGLNFMDPLVGLVGMLVILSWSVGLVRSAGGVLLDAVPDPALAQRIRERIETGGDRLADLHLWQVGPGRRSDRVGRFRCAAGAVGLQAAARGYRRTLPRDRRSESVPACGQIADCEIANGEVANSGWGFGLRGAGVGLFTTCCSPSAARCSAR